MAKFEVDLDLDNWTWADPPSDSEFVKRISVSAIEFAIEALSEDAYLDIGGQSDNEPTLEIALGECGEYMTVRFTADEVVEQLTRFLQPFFSDDVEAKRAFIVTTLEDIASRVREYHYVKD